MQSIALPLAKHCVATCKALRYHLQSIAFALVLARSLCATLNLALTYHKIIVINQKETEFREGNRTLLLQFLGKYYLCTVIVLQTNKSILNNYYQNGKKMKRKMMTLAAAVAAVSLNAQVYVGGNVGIANIDNGNDDETVYSLLPEVGYNLNSDIALGVQFGWSKGNLYSEYGDLTLGDVSLTHTFEVNPYVRYTFVHAKAIDVFFDGGFGYKHYNGEGDQFSVGLKPGIALNLNDKFSLVAHVGFLGYQNFNPKGDGDNTNVWGIDVDGNHVQLGVNIKF